MTIKQRLVVKVRIYKNGDGYGLVRILDTVRGCQAPKEFVLVQKVILQIGLMSYPEMLAFVADQVGSIFCILENTSCMLKATDIVTMEENVFNDLELVFTLNPDKYNKHGVSCLGIMTGEEEYCSVSPQWEHICKSLERDNTFVVSLAIPGAISPFKLLTQEERAKCFIPIYDYTNNEESSDSDLE